jgi:hypothetical protein
VADHSQMRLGRLPVKASAQAKLLKLSRYDVALPAPPPERDWLAKVADNGPVFLNDQLGCCTISALGHLIRVWSANNGNEIVVPDAAILTGYESVCGYVDGDPATDNGGVETTVLGYARTTGVGGYKIDAYVGLDQKNETHVRQSIDLFGAAYIGVDLPITAQTQDVWEVDLGAGENARRGSWGGHAILVSQYDADGLTAITWGQKKRLTWAWWEDYCTESYAPLGSLWMPNGRSPEGFDLVTLKADLAAVAS